MSDTVYRQKSTIPVKLLDTLFGKPVKVMPKFEFDSAINPVVNLKPASTSREVPSSSDVLWSSMVKEIDFETLGNNLAKYEKDFSLSTIKMFQQYLEGKMTDVEDIDEWVDTYILYLGCSQIRRYSCP